MRLRWFLLIMGVLVIGILSACSGQPTQSEMQLPSFLNTASSTIREAYQYAMANPHELEKYPCYCGCGGMGHTSNLGCYIDEIYADGTFAFDTHAVGCGICIVITRDVMQLREAGWSSPDIRTYIDEKYSVYGPPTNTPLPLG